MQQRTSLQIYPARIVTDRDERAGGGRVRHATAAEMADLPAPGAGSNLVYNGVKAAIMGIPTSGTPAARIDLIADTLKVMLIGTGVAYTPDADHRFVSSVVGSEISVTGYTGGFGGAGRKSLASRTLSADDTNDRGVFDAADLTWTALGSGATIGGAVLFKELTSDALSPLIAYYAFTNTPTNGGDITIQWSSSPSALLTLT